MPLLSVKHLRLKAGGLSLASKGGDDRQLDERPTRDGCTILGKRSQVLLPNIFGSVEVCVKLIAALAAKEDGLRTAIGTMLIATARTGLGGQPGVNCDDGDATLLGLVEGEGVQLGKRPAVQPAFVLDIPVSLAASYAGGLADIREVLEDEGRPGRGNGDEAFGEDMICVSGSLFQGFQPLEERKSRRFRKMNIPVGDQFGLLSFDNQVRGYFPAKDHNTSIARERPGIAHSPLGMLFLSIIPLPPAYPGEASLQPFEKSGTRCRNLDVSCIDRLMASVVKTTVETNAAIGINNAGKVRFIGFTQMPNDGLLGLRPKFVEPLVLLDAELMGPLHQAICLTAREQKGEFSLCGSWVDFAKQLIFFRGVVRVETHFLSIVEISLSVTLIIASLNEVLATTLESGQERTGAPLPARQLLQVSAGGLCSFGLQFALKAETTAFYFFPGPVSQELAGRGHGGAHQTQINPDDVLGRLNSGLGHADHDVQPPFPVAEEQISRSNRVACVLLAPVGNGKGQGQLARAGRQASFLLLPVEGKGFRIVTRWTEQTLRHLDGLELRGGFAALLGFSHLPGVGGLMFALPREGALQGFGGLHSGLNEQVGDQPRTGRFGVVVGGVVQPDPVLLPALPPVATDSVESDGKLSKRLMQGDRLLWGRIQLYAHRSVHIFLFFLPARFTGRHTNVL